MGSPRLHNWSLKRSGAAMTLTAVQEADGRLVKLTVLDVRKDDGTRDKTLAMAEGGTIYELI